MKLGMELSEILNKHIHQDFIFKENRGAQLVTDIFIFLHYFIIYYDFINIFEQEWSSLPLLFGVTSSLHTTFDEQFI